MRGIKRLNYARLAEIVGQRPGVHAEAVRATLADCGRSGALFPEELVRIGSATEWDLMRFVAVEFGLPILPAGQHDLDRDLIRTFPSDLLLRTLVLPLDRFQKILTVVMPVLAPVEVLEEIGARAGNEVMPFVGSPQENRRLLEGLLRPKSRQEGGSWEKIFDEANETILREVKSPK